MVAVLLLFSCLFEFSVVVFVAFVCACFFFFAFFFFFFAFFCFFVFFLHLIHEWLQMIKPINCFIIRV